MHAFPPIVYLNPDLSMIMATFLLLMSTYSALRLVLLMARISHAGRGALSLSQFVEGLFHFYLSSFLLSYRLASDMKTKWPPCRRLLSWVY